jgi:ferritin-like metal-binding protein YciE
MENGLIEILEHQVGDAENYPAIQTKLQEHLQQTRQHAEIVKGCIERMGGDVSTLKAGMASFMGKIQALSTGAAQDEMMKNALQDFAAENFEVASYTALAAAAMQVGEVEVATACQGILREDRAMAQWIEQNLATMAGTTINELTGAAVR